MHKNFYIAALIVVISLAGCTTSVSESSDRAKSEYSQDIVDQTVPADPEERSLEIRKVRSSTRPVDVKHAELCTDYCKGTLAGFEWAKQHAIREEPEFNLGEKLSYNEGCKRYVELVRVIRN